MLYPKKVKFRKWQRLTKNPKKIGPATRGTALAFGSYGLKAEAEKWITSQQIESVRKVLTRYVQKTGKMWIRIFPDKPITQRPPEVTMGAGKGDVAYFVASVVPGRILFEMGGVEEEIAKEAMRLASNKLPIATRFVARATIVATGGENVVRATVLALASLKNPEEAVARRKAEFEIKEAKSSG